MIKAMETRSEEKESLNSLLQALQKQQKNNQFCDIQIKVGVRIFPAHQCILAARSPVFSAMLVQGYRESEHGVVELREVEPDVFEKVLTFLYTQTIELDVESVCDVLFFSDMYQIKPLSDICSIFIKEKLDVDNCLHILIAAKQCSLPVLVYASLQVMRNYFLEEPTEDFYNLDIEHVNEILNHLNSFASLETEVFSGVMRWLAHSPSRSCHISAVLSKFNLKTLRGETVVKEIVDSDFMKQHPEARLGIMTELAVMCCSGVTLQSIPLKPQRTIFCRYARTNEIMKDGKLNPVMFEFMRSNWFVSVNLSDCKKFLVGVVHRIITNEEMRRDPSEFGPIRLRFQLELLHVSDPSQNLKSDCFTFTFCRNQYMRIIPLLLPIETFINSFVEKGNCYYTLKLWGLDTR